MGESHEVKTVESLYEFHNSTSLYIYIYLIFFVFEKDMKNDDFRCRFGVTTVVKVDFH